LLVNYEILRPRRSLRMTGEGNFPEVSRHIIFLFFAIFKKNGFRKSPHQSRERYQDHIDNSLIF